MNMRNKILVLLLLILLFGAGAAFAGWDDVLRNLQYDHPIIYSILQFFNSLSFNNPLFITFMVIFAIGTVPCIFVFEGWPKVFFILLSLFCWTGIVGLFVNFYIKAR